MPTAGKSLLRLGRHDLKARVCWLPQRPSSSCCYLFEVGNLGGHSLPQRRRGEKPSHRAISGYCFHCKHCARRLGCQKRSLGVYCPAAAPASSYWDHPYFYSLQWMQQLPILAVPNRSKRQDGGAKMRSRSRRDLAGKDLGKFRGAGLLQCGFTWLII